LPGQTKKPPLGFHRQRLFELLMVHWGNNQIFSLMGPSSVQRQLKSLATTYSSTA
jgi:hypothetical protein